MIDSLVPSMQETVPTLSAIFADTATAAGDERWWRFLGRLHPLVVHFPIGLALAAAGVEFVNILRRRPEASPFGITATALAAIAACFAAWFGWLNADYEGATVDNTLFLHRWLGIVGAAGLLVVWFVGLAGRSGDRHAALNGYRWGLVVVAVVVGVGAHFGGEMVYGKGYLTKVLLPPPAKVQVVDATGGGDEGEGETTTADSTEPGTSGDAAAGGTTRVSFQRQVLPIFEARCIECHGPDKVKGSLRMDTVAHLFGEDPEWWTVVPGKPDESLLLERIELPADDPDAMPPKGDRLTPAEITVIRDWIAEGAEDDAGAAGGAVTETKAGTGTQAGATTDAATASETAADTAPGGPDRPDRPDMAAIEAAVTALRERQILVMPIAQGSDDWEVNASLIDPAFGDDDLARLDGLQPVLVWANFARSGLTDAGIAPLGDFGSLTRLRLDNTAIGDGAVTTLLRLPKLELINLYGSKLTDAGLAELATHPTLTRIYCAGTAVTPEGVQAAARDGLEIVGPAALAEPAVEPETSDAPPAAS